MKKIITYGTYDLLHLGHINLLKRAKALGDYLIVGLSSDNFNKIKNKDCFLPFEHRKIVLESLKFVDKVICEENWEQKENDIIEHKVNIFVMGDDWKGKFDHLNHLCEVIYLPRTENISTTLLKNNIEVKIKSKSKKPKKHAKSKR